MRIISGKWKGHSLQRPEATITRPTMDRVREALFSMLTSRLKSFAGVTAVDAFAGSGALGLEVLSRGGSFVFFSENNIKTRHILLANIKKLSAQDQATVAFSFQALNDTAAPVDLVFLDPPYGAGLEFEAMTALLQKGYVGPNTLIIVETQRSSVPQDFKDPLSNNSSKFENLEIRAFGNCALSFWKLSV
jgi:16S rRNA (guanine966-N2)-methyltransferase